MPQPLIDRLEENLRGACEEKGWEIGGDFAYFADAAEAVDNFFTSS